MIIHQSGNMNDDGTLIRPSGDGGAGGCMFIDPYLYGCPGGYVSRARVVDAVPEYPVRVCAHVNREPVNLLVTGEHVADICVDCQAALPLLPHTRV